MANFPTRRLWSASYLLALLAVFPAYADPFFVRVYGRTYKVDPRYASDEPEGPEPQQAMRALPSDLAKGPGFRPSHEQVLDEVEERLWIAKHQLDDELGKAAAARSGATQERMRMPSSRRSQGRSQPERRRAARRTCKSSSTAIAP